MNDLFCPRTPVLSGARALTLAGLVALVVATRQRLRGRRWRGRHA